MTKSYEDIAKGMINIGNMNEEERQALVDLINACKATEEEIQLNLKEEEREIFLKYMIKSYNEGYLSGMLAYASMFFEIFDKCFDLYRETWFSEFYQTLKDKTESYLNESDEKMRFILSGEQDWFAKRYFDCKFGISYHNKELLGFKNTAIDDVFFVMDFEDDIEKFINMYFISTGIVDSGLDVDFDGDAFSIHINNFINDELEKIEKTEEELNMNELKDLSEKVLNVIRNDMFKYVS